MPQQFSIELQTAIDAAKEGAKTALSFFDNDTNLQVSTKADNTKVTIADKKTEEVIKNFILSKFPDANILGEESGGSLENNSFWVIDPIDGTRSFIRGIPTWAVLIAYCKDKKFKIGVCYFPVLNSILWAETGKGAYLDGKRVNVSKIDSLKKAYVAGGNVKHFTNKQVIWDLIDKSYIARFPEATHAAYLVASGKFDVLADVKAMLWDFAPFLTIIKEAGGKITNTKGDEPRLTDNGYIASNGLLHDEVVKIVNQQ